MNMYYEVDSTLHIRLTRGRIGPDSGLVSKVNIKNGYRIRFISNIRCSGEKYNCLLNGEQIG